MTLKPGISGTKTKRKTTRRKRSSPPNQHEVRIEIQRQFAWMLTKDMEAAIDQLAELEVQAAWQESGFWKGVHRISAPIELDDNKVAFPAGLVDEVVRLLQERGNNVLVEDVTLWEQFHRADRALFESDPHALLPYQQRFLEAIQDKPRGLFALHRMSDRLGLISILEKYYSAENILIVTKNGETSKRLAKSLEGTTKRQVSWGPNWDLEWDTSPQIHVTSLAGLVYADVTAWGVVIIADGESAQSHSSAAHLNCMDESLWFAFIPADRIYHLEEQLMLEAFFGPEIYRLDDTPPCWSKVTVLLAGPCSYPASSTMNPLERKRTYIWHNDQRNRLIADIAQALEVWNQRKLQELGMDVSSHSPFLSERKKNLTLAILAEVPEHGRALANYLPGWELLDSRDTEPNMDIGCPLFINRAIVTHSRALRTSIVADIVIRAEGTFHEWCINYGSNPTLLGGPSKLIVDIRDDFDELASHDTQRRREDYQERGWTVR